MSSQQSPGIRVAVHGHPNADTLLLWHPAVRTDPDAVAALASRIATRAKVRVVVPHWTDGIDLLRSVRYARESSVHPPDGLSVVGYAEAGIAALSLALHQRRLGIGLARATCVDGGADLTDPISGQPLVAAASPVTTEIDVIDSADAGSDPWAAQIVDAWKTAGWAASLVPAAQFTWRVNPSQ